MEGPFENPLDEYLYRGEDETLEFKQTLNSEFKIAKTLSAFANTSGGVILVGVKDNRSLVGVDPDEERHIVELAADFCTVPPVRIEIEEIYFSSSREDDKERVILKVTVFPGADKPHYAIDASGARQAYLRQKDKTLIAGGQAVAFMKRTDEEQKPGYDDLTKNEKRLVAYLRRYEKITLKKYMALVNISERRAKRELNDAMGKGVVRILEHEREPYFTL